MNIIELTGNIVSLNEKLLSGLHKEVYVLVWYHACLLNLD